MVNIKRTCTHGREAILHRYNLRIAQQCPPQYAPQVFWEKWESRKKSNQNMNRGMKWSAIFWRKCLQCISQGFSVSANFCNLFSSFTYLKEQENGNEKAKRDEDDTSRKQLCYWVFHSDSPLRGYTCSISSYFQFLIKYLHESVSCFSSRHVFFKLLLPVQNLNLNYILTSYYKAKYSYRTLEL